MDRETRAFVPYRPVKCCWLTSIGVALAYKDALDDAERLARCMEACVAPEGEQQHQDHMILHGQDMIRECIESDRPGHL